MHLKPQKTAAAVATFFGVVHLAWAVIVGLGWATGLMKFVYRAHMIRPAPSIAPFDLTNAFMLVIFAIVVGYVLGYVFAYIWNRAH